MSSHPLAQKDLWCASTWQGEAGRHAEQVQEGRETRAWTAGEQMALPLKLLLICSQVWVIAGVSPRPAVLRRLRGERAG